MNNLPCFHADAIADAVPDPMANHTWGGRLVGDGFAAGTAGEAENEGKRTKSWSLRTKEPITRIHLRAVLRIAQDPTVEAWEKSVADLDSRTRGSAAADHARTTAWWSEFWNARWPSGGNWEEGWRKYSEIALYRSEGARLEGPFHYVNTVLKGCGEGWDAVGMHNPCIRKVDAKYVLLHIANDWQGGLKEHGPNQRIGMRIADSLEGPWRKAGKAGMILEPGAWCAGSACGVNNPVYARSPDGRHLIYFKACPGPRREGIRMGVAVADQLEGPYSIHEQPITANEYYIEDGTAFVWGKQICLITTDNHGAIERGGGLLWVSESPCTRFIRSGSTSRAASLRGPSWCMARRRNSSARKC